MCRLGGGSRVRESVGGAGRLAVDEFTALHQDVAGAVSPASLQTQGEPAVGMFFQTLVCERRSRDVAAQALESAAIAGRHCHRGVEAQAAVLRNRLLESNEVDALARCWAE